MSLHRIQSFALALACLTLAGQALAQTAPAPNGPAPSAPAQTTPGPNVPTPPAADETFLTGLRRVGVMAGQVVECSADADRQAKIGQAMELANKIAIHFGLKAASTMSAPLATVRGARSIKPTAASRRRVGRRSKLNT